MPRGRGRRRRQRYVSWRMSGKERCERIGDEVEGGGRMLAFGGRGGARDGDECVSGGKGIGREAPALFLLQLRECIAHGIRIEDRDGRVAIRARRIAGEVHWTAT